MFGGREVGVLGSTYDADRSIGELGAEVCVLQAVYLDVVDVSHYET